MTNLTDLDYAKDPAEKFAAGFTVFALKFENAFGLDQSTTLDQKQINLICQIYERCGDELFDVTPNEKQYVHEIAKGLR